MTIKVQKTNTLLFLFKKKKHKKGSQIRILPIVRISGVDRKCECQPKASYIYLNQRPNHHQIFKYYLSLYLAAMFAYS